MRTRTWLRAGCGMDSNTWMMSGGGSTTMSDGEMGNEVEMERKIWRDCLKVSESGTSRLN